MKTFSHLLVSAFIAVLIAVMSFSVFSQGRVKVDVGQGDDKKVIYSLLENEDQIDKGFRDFLTRRGVAFRMLVRKFNASKEIGSEFVEEIQRINPDLVYTKGTIATTNVFGEYGDDTGDLYVNNIPGVFAFVAFPQQDNIVNSLENSGRQLTGVDFIAPLSAQMEAIMAYRKFNKIAIIYDTNSIAALTNADKLRTAVENYDIKLLEIPMPTNDYGESDPNLFSEIINQAKEKGADLLYIGTDLFMIKHADIYTEVATKAGLATFSATQGPLLNSRALFGLVTDYYALGRKTATLAEKILKTKKVPMEIKKYPMYKLLINMDAARKIDLYPPLEIISVADFINNDLE